MRRKQTLIIHQSITSGSGNKYRMSEASAALWRWNGRVLKAVLKSLDTQKVMKMSGNSDTQRNDTELWKFVFYIPFVEQLNLTSDTQHKKCVVAKREQINNYIVLLLEHERRRHNVRSARRCMTARAQDCQRKSIKALKLILLAVKIAWNKELGTQISWTVNFPKIGLCSRIFQSCERESFFARKLNSEKISLAVESV